MKNKNYNKSALTQMFENDPLGPAPAPRFSRTPTSVRSGVIDPNTGSRAALRNWGIAEAVIDDLAAKAVIPAG